MTNEEAIFELGYAKDFQTPKRREAIDMAIEALENNDKLAEDLQNCLEMYKKKKAEVEALKKNQWIPCEERLPSRGVSVLVSGIMKDAPPITISTDAPHYYKEGWINAWMPLPKPYEGRNRMSDLISRADAIDAIEDESSKGHYSCFASYSDAQKFKQIVNELPSAERVGEWIEDDDPTVKGHCSVCGWKAHYYEDDVFGMPFCPNCGSHNPTIKRMEGAEE